MAAAFRVLHFGAHFYKPPAFSSPHTTTRTL
jgi:hypothetical protein